MYEVEHKDHAALKEKYENTKSTCDYFFHECESYQEKNRKLSTNNENLKIEINKMSREIDKMSREIEELKATIKRQDQQLTEKELYEKKSKETAPTGVPAIDATVDRLIKLEAKFEAKENPYFF
jgi:predicted RNase H-like nuclease (RuvC/YqgF family)